MGSTANGAVVLVASTVLLAGCGTGEAPPAGEDGLVAATPRALAAVVIDHVDPGEPRRTTGNWSAWNDPLELEAQVDYGVDPEGTEDGESHTVRVTVADPAVYDREDRRWFDCRAEEGDDCQSEEVDGGRLVYRWWPGTEEEEPGSYAWMVVRESEVVLVAYDGSGLFDQDPRGLDLPVQPEDLRKAALDPAMSLRTTPDAWQQGANLDNYEGVEEPPEEPDVAATTPRQLAAAARDVIGLRPASVRRSRLGDLGPGAVGVHLEFDGSPGHDPFTVDLLTATGRAPLVDPTPCPPQEDGEPPRPDCFAWNADNVATWTLAEDGRPGELWIVGAHRDGRFNRVESVAVRVVSTGIIAPFFTEAGHADNRLPHDFLGTIAGLAVDRSLGPETVVPR